MKKAYIAAAIATTFFISACETGKNEEQADVVMALETDTQKQSYALGANMGRFSADTFEKQESLGMEVDRAALVAGFEAALNGNSQLSDEEIQTLNTAAEAAFREALQAEAEQTAAANIEAGKAYLAENAQREEVTVTESGLQYEVLSAGEGASPVASDTVTVHYQGTLIDGTEFDSSYGRGEPASFPLNRVISGWTEGLQLMQEGAKYRFHIPSDLAYGARATGSIPANSTLIFDVELLSVQTPEAPEE
ncbi:FKBP-type peptidyl-prolyl cis-trans isomerase [Ningiella sp. W23]|uniref:FKBP-type peptidyl-prolyl cis-trans isomerase n=1 Tax=Ningiella sp. W23 TaxID=3023715 RepID=UPI003756798B